ncbi:MAG TPA: DMT family transporter [Clostridia bacterium]|nr:DMT family transporter [Clostridia bacterium]
MQLLKYLSSLLLFGSNGVVASFILLNSYEIVFSRTLIGSLLLIAIFIFGRNRLHFRENRPQLLYLVVSGAAMGASWMFLYEAYVRIGVGVATLAYYCGPVIVMALAPVVFKERLTFSKIIGFIAVLIGMFCVNGAALTKSGLSWGLVCGILSAVMYAVMVIFNKKATGMKGLQNSMCQLVVSFITVAIFTFVKQGAAFSVPHESILPILFLGMVNTGVGCYLYFSSIQKLPAQSVAICGYLEPLSALLFSALFLQERLSALQTVGAILILGGAAFGELYRYNKVFIRKQA